MGKKSKKKQTEVVDPENGRTFANQEAPTSEHRKSVPGEAHSGQDGNSTPNQSASRSPRSPAHVADEDDVVQEESPGASPQRQPAEQWSGRQPHLKEITNLEFGKDSSTKKQERQGSQTPNVPDHNKVFQYEGIRSSNSLLGGAWTSDTVNLRINESLSTGGEFAAKAMPLISWNTQTDSFEINEQARRIVSRIKGPIGVVAVAGVYRTGKSHLLNRVLLQQQNGSGFGVGPSINPCTKGLWMWATPLVGYAEDGEKMNVLVVDSEGIGGLDEDGNHDMRIFSLALLLSSFFVYNSMGSIDENALASLSFVSNISKHIKVKTLAGQKDSDLSTEKQNEDDLTRYMPKFLWVVRDFTLQLVDDENKEISAKQYLERALADAETSSESEAGGKNGVKEHIRKFFPQRDCYTMVRPIVDESNLQSLDSIGVQDLRPEFVEQVAELRTKILQGMKLKQINNHRMDGAIWIDMVQQYITAMNDGTVPSIASSWTNICRSRAQASYDRLKAAFEESVAHELQLPTNERDLEQCIEYHAEMLKTELSQDFNGEKEVTEDFLQQLDEYLKARWAELRAHNLAECHQLSTNTLTQLFQELNQRFMNDNSNHTTVENLSQQVKALDYTLQEIWGLYDGNVPEYSEKHLIFLNAKSSFLNDLVYFVHANLENENQSVNNMLNEIKDRNHSAILEAKEGFRIEKQAMESKLKETMLAKTETEAALELLKEQYEAMKSSKEQEEQQSHLKQKALKDQYLQKLEEQRKDKEEFDEKIQEMNRKNIKVESEFEKERALLEQKVLFLEKNLEEKLSKEKEYLSNWNNQKSELSNEIRNVSQKYEQELKQSSQLLEEEKEKVSELEAQLQKLQSTYDEESAAWLEQESRYKVMIDQTQDHAKQIEMAANALGKEDLADIEQQLQEKTEKLNELTATFKEAEERMLQNEEELKLKLQQSLKDMALKDQKLEFVEIQLKDTRSQLEEANKQHQSMVEAMNTNVENEVNTKNEPDASESTNESPSKMDRLQARIESLQSQLSTAQDRAQELELELKLRASDAERSQTTLQDKIEDLEQQRLTMSNKITDSEASKSNYVEQLEKNYKAHIVKLEQELEDKHQNNEKDIKQIQHRSEESLASLKKFYENEKEKLELRLREEREKAQKKINEYHEEFELKMHGEFAEKDEEMEMLRDSYAALEQRHNQQATQVQHELNMKHQIIENLEKQNQDQKQRIEMMESNRNQAFEKQLEFFEQQRQEYNGKIDKLQNDNIDKDRQLAQLQHKHERALEDLQRKMRDLTQYQEQLEHEKELLESKLEQTKQKLSDIQDEAQQNQLVYGRDQALSQQSIEFLQRKVQEMQNQLEEKTQMYELKYQSVRSELAEENQSHIERIQGERDAWEQKFEQKRKALKEIEQQLNRENAELEKKLCLLQENYTRVEQGRRQMEVEYQEKIQEYEAQIQNLDSSAGEAFYYGNAQAESIMQLKTTMQELERQLSDLQSTYDKDKALWEGKCQFLENQKENYKRDLIESQRKFEITLEQLQKRGNSAQDKYEYNQNAMMKVIENKYKNQIKEMLESHQCLQAEVTNKGKRLEEDNKRLTQENAITKRELQLKIQQLEQKAQEAAKMEASLKNELHELKAERDKKVQELQQQAQADKEAFKNRVAEAEKKAKELDARRTQMIFDFEKEKARWQMEYDDVVNQHRELEDVIATLERRKDLLFKENERLKAEWKAGSQGMGSRSSVERRSAGSALGSGSLSIAPKLALGLSNALNASTSGLPPSSVGYHSKGKHSSALKPAKAGLASNQKASNPGSYAGSMNTSMSGLKPNQLSLGLNLGGQGNVAAPQPQKHQFQMQPLQFSGNQQQMNTRYGNLSNSGANSAHAEGSQPSNSHKQTPQSTSIRTSQDHLALQPEPQTLSHQPHAFDSGRKPTQPGGASSSSKTILKPSTSNLNNANTLSKNNSTKGSELNTPPKALQYTSSYQNPSKNYGLKTSSRYLQRNENS